MNEEQKHNIVTGLINQGKSKRISRRQFMQDAIALGVTVASASTLWSTQVLAETPNQGGKFRFGKGHGGTTDKLDPGHHENGFTIAMVQGMANYLTEVGSDGAVKAEVAESWEASPDAATWRFKLRKGMTFHNGKDVAVSDIIASINHHRGEDSQSAAKPILEDIAEIKADGDVVEFKLNGGNADFPYVVSDYHLPILPGRDNGSLDYEAGVGSGAYRLKKFDPGVRADFERNPDYWKSDRGHFDEIEMITITDPASRTNAIVSGEVDAIDKVDLKTVALLARKPGLNVHQVTGTQHYTFPMRTNIAPFDNNDVRLALKYANNREELVEKVLQGYGEVGNDHPIGSGQQYHASSLEQTSYNPELAKEHLKKAGLDSLAVDLNVSDAAFSGAIDAAQLFAESAKAANININVVREPNDGYWSNVWNVKPFCASYWGGRPTVDWMLATTYASGVPWNDTVFEHARFNEVLLAARSELDDAKRTVMYLELQTILNREGGALVPMFASYVFATTDKIGHPEQFGSNWDNDGERSFERWWFNS